MTEQTKKMVIIRPATYEALSKHSEKSGVKIDGGMNLPIGDKLAIFVDDDVAAVLGTDPDATILKAIGVLSGDDIVFAGGECPSCCENRVDYLANDEGHINCQTCQNEYDIS